MVIVLVRCFAFCKTTDKSSFYHRCRVPQRSMLFSISSSVCCVGHTQQVAHSAEYFQSSHDIFEISPYSRVLTSC